MHHDRGGEAIADTVNLDQRVVGSSEGTVGGKIQRAVFDGFGNRSKGYRFGLRNAQGYETGHSRLSHSGRGR